jgi:hydroxymethylbilane synthase
MTLADLGTGARIGTGAVRRIAQLHAARRGWEPVPIRGNVDTRLRKVAEGELDAVILARAGIARLGRAGEITETLDPLTMLPAPAQGALAVECRIDDVETADLLAVLDDEYSRAAVAAERALLATLEAGCSAPVAALAEVAEGDDGPEVYLRGAVFSPDGANTIRLSRTGTLADPAEVGRALARDLRAEGADQLMGDQE